jgi:hypothetical protein
MQSRRFVTTFAPIARVKRGKRPYGVLEELNREFRSAFVMAVEVFFRLSPEAILANLE